MTIIGSTPARLLTVAEQELLDDLLELKARVARFEARHPWLAKYTTPGAK